MIIAKNDEAKRSKIWRITTAVSSVLIVVIAVYLLTKLFTSNPLEGSWEDEDGNFAMTIKSNGTVVITLPELSENTDVDVKMNYTLDKDEKTISMHLDEEEIQRLSEKSDGQYTKEMLESAVGVIGTTFNYSVDHSQLTLTEREYGEQLIFLKK